jgi:hypothetical protein
LTDWRASDASATDFGNLRLVADVYLLRFGSAEEIDLYLTDEVQSAGGSPGDSDRVNRSKPRFGDFRKAD